MSENLPLITEVKLEPLHIQGELVPNYWWEAPQPKHIPFWRRHWLFLVIVCVPMALASLYLGLIASDQFISEARFVVRAAARADVANLASLMQGEKLSRATDETFAVSEYMQSRDAMQALVTHDHLREILSRPQADFLSRFPNFHSRASDEALFRHLQNIISVKIDSESGISTLRTRAFSAQDSHALTSALLRHGEELVNRMNARAYDDALRFANKIVEEQKSKLLDVEAKLTDYRNSQKIIDPSKESAVALTSVGTMMTELMELEAAAKQQISVAANSPTIGPMLEKIRSYTDQIAKERMKIAGDNASIAGKLGAYEQLMLDRELAARGLEAAVIHLTVARQNAEQQQLYLETIVEPNFADESRYPRRGLVLLALLAGCLCLYFIAKTFIGSVMEHQP